MLTSKLICIFSNFHFIDENINELVSSDGSPDKHYEDLAIITAFLDYNDKLLKAQALKPYQSNGGSSPWKDFGRKKGVIRK